MIITLLKYKLFFFFNYLLAVLGLHCCSGFSLVAASWNYSLAVVRGFSCCRAWPLGCMGFSSCSSRALEHRLNSCGAWA